MFALIARDVRTGPGEDCTSPKNELDTACAFCDRIEKMELRELNMMRLPSCVMTLTVSEMKSRVTVLVSARNNIRDQLLPADRFFHAVQILDAVGIWTKVKEVRKQVVPGIAAVFSVKLSDSVTREHLREVLGHPVLCELADNATGYAYHSSGSYRYRFDCILTPLSRGDERTTLDALALVHSRDGETLLRLS